MEQIFNTHISWWSISYIIGVIGGAIIGFSISIGLPRKRRCRHNWKLIEDGQLFRYSKGRPQEIVGFMKVYECTHCYEMKKERITI